MTSEIITKVIELVILGLSILVGRYVIPWLREKVNFIYMNEIVAWAKTFVKSAEMLVKGEKMGDEKLEMVTKLLEEKLAELGIVLSAEQVRSIIEEAVYNIQNQ